MSSSRSFRIRERWAVLGIVLAVFGGSAVAQEARVELTPFWGYRFGGQVQDYRTGANIDIDPDQAYGIGVGIRTDVDVLFELTWSRQETSFGSGPSLAFQTVPLDVELFHLGAVREFKEDQTVRPFVTGSIGATHFDPKVSDLGSDTRFSMALGGGIKLYFRPRLGLRLQARGIFTFVNASAAGFCGTASGCSIVFSGNGLFQGEVTAGVIVGF